MQRVLLSSFPSRVQADRLLAAAVATAWILLSAWAVHSRLAPWPDMLLRNDFISFLTGGSLVRTGTGPDLFNLETQRAFEERLRLGLATVDPQGLATAPARYFYYPPPLTMVNWRTLLANVWPALPPDTVSTLVLVLGIATVLISLLAWRGDWGPASDRFPRQVAALTLATLLATPHGHFHGTVLLLAPLALALSRQPDRAPLLSWGWSPMVAVGYLLAFVGWPLRIRLMVPYLLLALGFLIVQCWREHRSG